MLKIPKMLVFICLVGLCCGSMAFAAKRVGPVSEYGQLQAGTNEAGHGRIYGSCKAYSTSGNEVQVKGMSLFWSINPQSAKFWNARIITGLVEKHNVQLIRAAMGVDEDWGAGNYFTDTLRYQKMMDEVVQAAIDNDIYVIIDYHSHTAHENVAKAKRFFKRMAKKWGAYDNVIFDIYNEPACIKNGNGDCTTPKFGGAFVEWPAIKKYAEQVVATIRKYSDNLILVGTPQWSQRPQAAASDPVKDPAKNTAYTFHYYAGGHEVSVIGRNAKAAIDRGLSIFVSEWGTVHAVFKGRVAKSNGVWQDWMNALKLSSANWALTNLVEDTKENRRGDGQGSSYFAADFDPDDPNAEWKYSNSGEWVNKRVFAKLPTQYTKCKK